MFTTTPSDSQPEKTSQGKLGLFLQAPQGQALLRIVTTVVTLLIEHYFGW